MKRPCLKQVIVALAVILVTWSLCSCAEEIQFSYSDTSADPIQVSIVLFINPDEDGYDKDGELYQYRTIRTLTAEQAQVFLEKLADIVFKDELLSPLSPEGLGVVLTYEDQTQVFISETSYDDHSVSRPYEFNQLILRTLADSAEE